MLVERSSVGAGASGRASEEFKLTVVWMEFSDGFEVLKDGACAIPDKDMWEKLGDLCRGELSPAFEDVSLGLGVGSIAAAIEAADMWVMLVERGSADGGVGPTSEGAFKLVGV